MDALVKRRTDFEALRAKFQEHDVIKNLQVAESECSRAPEATAVSDSKTGLNVTKVDVIETVSPHNATVQQSHTKSPCSPLHLAKPTVVPKPVLLKLPEWIEPSVPVEGGGRPEELTNSNPASIDIQALEHKTSKDSKRNNQDSKITFKEKINIWENSSHCGREASTPGQNLKCSTLPPSLVNLRLKPLSETPYKITCVTKGSQRMGPEEQISDVGNGMLQLEESTTVIQSCEDSSVATNSKPTVPYSQPEIDLPTQNDQKGFKRDNVLESGSQDLLRLDLTNCGRSKLTDQRGQNIMEREHLHKSMHRRALPSIEELGPPPVKPPRPFKVDLSILRNIKMDSCCSMESAKKNDTPSSPIKPPEKDASLSTESNAQEANDEKVRHHREMGQEKELQNRAIEEKELDQVKEHENKKERELRKKFNLTGSEIPILKVQIQEYLKGGKFNLKVKPGEMVEIIRMVDCPAGKWLAKTQDGNCGYIQIDAVKMNNAEIKEISYRMSNPPRMIEEVYDDVGMYDDVGLPDMTTEQYSIKMLNSIECGQCHETMDIKNELEKNSANKMNRLTKILHKGKEKKKGHESPSQAQQSECGLTSNIYDDVLSEAMKSPIDRSSQIQLADNESLHEEIYDDVETGSSEAIKKDRIKELGKLFKKEIGDGGKEKKKKKDKALDHLSINSGSGSTLSLTNLDSDENSVYEDVTNVKELSDSEDKSSKSDTSKINWGKVFRKRGENAKKTGEMKLEESERLEFGKGDYFTMDIKAPREKVKGIFKIKRKDPSGERESKVNKKKMLNEQEFREKFNYTKEIVVENVAVVEHNVVQQQKGSLYLPVKSGEKLEVIDIGEDNLIICRNTQGKYGYVHVQHLIFGT